MAAFGRRPARRDEDTAPFDPYTAALRWLGARELSVHQVRQRLARRTDDEAGIEGAIQRLTASGALDDRRVARAVARTLSQVKRRGRERIARELAAMGIDADTTRAALEDICPPEAESNRLAAAIARRARGRDLSDPAETRRLYAALLRQGFEADAIRRALLRGREGDLDE
jgi:regulatory protein